MSARSGLSVRLLWLQCCVLALLLVLLLCAALLSPSGLAVWPSPLSFPALARRGSARSPALTLTSTSVASQDSSPFPQPPWIPCRGEELGFGQEVQSVADSTVAMKAAEWHAALQKAASYEGATWGSQSRGVVTSFPPSQLHRLLFLVHLLYSVYDSPLRLEVFYLSTETEAVEPHWPRFAPYPLVSFRMLHEKAQSNKSDGYFVKPAALLHSSAHHVLWLDVDNLPLREPSYLFDLDEYLLTGALFWPDYWQQSALQPVFSVLSAPCNGAQPQQESGQLLIDVQRHWQALHLVLHMNMEEDFYHQFMLGDKDTFYLAWLALRTPYHFIRRYPSTTGRMETTTDGGHDSFCGLAMLQYDTRDQAVFLHANLLKTLLNDSQLPLHGPYFSHTQRFLADTNNPNLTVNLVMSTHGQGYCVQLPHSTRTQHELVASEATITGMDDQLHRFMQREQARRERE